MSQIDDIPPECFRERIDPLALRAEWSRLAFLIEMLDEFEREMLQSDELWLFDFGACTGLAIRRNGAVVKKRIYLHASGR
jgi:hypothetical protein